MLKLEGASRAASKSSSLQRRRDFDGVEQADSPALENGVQGGMQGRLHVAIAT
jgi:hypothetical protein